MRKGKDQRHQRLFSIETVTEVQHKSHNTLLMTCTASSTALLASSSSSSSSPQYVRYSAFSRPSLPCNIYACRHIPNKCSISFGIKFEFESFLNNKNAHNLIPFAESEFSNSSPSMAPSSAKCTHISGNDAFSIGLVQQKVHICTGTAQNLTVHQLSKT